MTARRRYLLLAAILLIATFLRFYHFTTAPPGLYPDEAMDGNNALEITHAPSFWRALKVYYPEDNGREGLYVNLVAILIKISGGVHEPWIVRFPAAISGILTVLGVYFLGAELFGEDVGLLGAFLLATSFWHINFSRIGFRAILAPLFLVWALYFLLNAIRSRNSGFVIPASAIGGIAYGLGFYTYIAYRVTPLLLLLFVPFFRGEKYFLRAAKVFLAVTFVVALPIGLYYLHHPADFFGRTSQISIWNSAHPLHDLTLNIGNTMAMFNFRGDGNWRHNISGAPELFWPVGLLFLLGIVLGIRPPGRNSRSKSSKRKPKSGGGGVNENFSRLLIFSWFLVTMLPVVFSNEGIPHALRSILMLPAAVLFAAIGGAALYRWLARHMQTPWLTYVAHLSLVLLALQAYSAYFNVWAKNPNVPGAFNAGYVTVGRKINALPPKVPKYVVVEGDGIIARGIPVPAQTTMFITDSFTTAQQTAQNIHYVRSQAKSTIPPGAVVFYIR